MDKMDDIDKIKQLAADALQEDINRWQQKLRSLVKEYTSRLSEVKQKQWVSMKDILTSGTVEAFWSVFSVVHFYSAYLFFFISV